MFYLEIERSVSGGGRVGWREERGNCDQDILYEKNNLPSIKNKTK